MADYPPITLAGGVKATLPSAHHQPTRALASRTPAEHAFAALIERLDETIAALARLADPASFDPALAAITAEDLTALDALDAAADRVKRIAPVVTSDRALLTAAHFMAFTLTMQSPAERMAHLTVLQDTHPIFAIPEPRRNTRHVRAMIDRAIARFRMVVEMMDCPVSLEYGDTSPAPSAPGAVSGAACVEPFAVMDDVELVI